MMSINWLGTEGYSEVKIEAQLPSRGSVLTQHMKKSFNEIFWGKGRSAEEKSSIFHFLLECD